MDDKLLWGYAVVKGRIYLFCEDKTDGIVIQKLLVAKGFNIDVQIRPPTGGKGGISRLARDLPRLIASERPNVKKFGKRACMVVLHDADWTTDPDGENQKKIKEICTKEKIKLIVANDELESWLLADSRVSKWLGQKARNFDNDKRSSDTLNKWLKDANKPRLDGYMKEQIASRAKGDGDKFSPSMKAAIEQLKNAPCSK